ncbi:dihydrodipicolinate synthase family protein [Synergistaceae bacterium OttesenSCG-928-I11]|nr:dihydrodipicolinate synthase family protein [Synergistaceae bacterium OttesenSCG-928-I11]
MMYKPYGVLASLVTPFDKDGGIKEKALREHIAWVADAGVHGIGVGPNTGEFVNLTFDDIKKLTDIAVDAAKGRVPVTIGALSASLRANIEILKYAKEAGADSVLVQAPYYLPISMDKLVDYFKALGNVGIPMIIFNHPYKTPYNLQPSFYEKLLDIKTFVGVKEVDMNMGNNARRTAFFKEAKISYLMGEEYMTFYHYLHGGDGCYPALVNIVPDLCVGLYDACKKGDVTTAEKIHMDMLSLGEAVYVENYPSGLKEAMEMIGRDGGVTREPVGRLTKESREKVRLVLQKLGRL